MDNKGEYQGQKRTQTFEHQVLQFITEKKRILNVHEKQFVELDNFQANTTVFQTNINATLKNLETKVGKLALSLQSKSSNTFPISIKINPKDLTPTVMSVTTDSQSDSNSGSEPGSGCNTTKYTLVVFDMFRVFCKPNLNVS